MDGRVRRGAAAAGRGLGALAAAALLVASGCGRKTPAAEPPVAPAASSAPLPPAMQRIQSRLDLLADQTKAEDAQDARDRAELVTPAPAGFVPSVQGRRLALRLIPKSPRLRVGAAFWYRVEVQNIGSEPVTISDSFIKSGFDDDSVKFKVVVTPRHWKETLVPGDGVPCLSEHLPILGWAGMSESQRVSALAAYRRDESLARRVSIRLNPGETVRTRDERYVSEEESCAAFQAGRKASDRPGGLFREYFEKRDFDRPGRYLVRVELNDPVLPFLEERRAALRRRGFTDSVISRHERKLGEIHLGAAQSEDVVIEVVR